MRPPDDRVPPEWVTKPYPLTFGAFVGAAALTHCLCEWDEEPRLGSPLFAVYREFMDDEWASGPCLLILRGAVEFRHPLPFKANVGLRSVPRIVIDQLHPRDAAAVLRLAARKNGT